MNQNENGTLIAASANDDGKHQNESSRFEESSQTSSKLLLSEHSEGRNLDLTDVTSEGDSAANKKKLPPPMKLKKPSAKEYSDKFYKRRISRTPEGKDFSKLPEDDRRLISDFRTAVEGVHEKMSRLRQQADARDEDDLDERIERVVESRMGRWVDLYLDPSVNVELRHRLSDGEKRTRRRRRSLDETSSTDRRYGSCRSAELEDVDLYHQRIPRQYEDEKYFSKYPSTQDRYTESVPSKSKKNSQKSKVKSNKSSHRLRRYGSDSELDVVSNSEWNQEQEQYRKMRDFHYDNVIRNAFNVPYRLLDGRVNEENYNNNLNNSFLTSNKYRALNSSDPMLNYFDPQYGRIAENPRYSNLENNNTSRHPNRNLSERYGKVEISPHRIHDKFDVGMTSEQQCPNPELNHEGYGRRNIDYLNPNNREFSGIISNPPKHNHGDLVPKFSSTDVNRSRLAQNKMFETSLANDINTFYPGPLNYENFHSIPNAPQHFGRYLEEFNEPVTDLGVPSLGGWGTGAVEGFNFAQGIVPSDYLHSRARNENELVGNPIMSSKPSITNQGDPPRHNDFTLFGNVPVVSVGSLPGFQTHMPNIRLQNSNVPQVLRNISHITPPTLTRSLSDSALHKPSEYFGLLSKVDGSSFVYLKGTPMSAWNEVTGDFQAPGSGTLPQAAQVCSGNIMFNVVPRFHNVGKSTLTVTTNETSNYAVRSLQHDRVLSDSISPMGGASLPSHNVSLSHNVSNGLNTFSLNHIYQTGNLSNPQWDRNITFNMSSLPMNTEMMMLNSAKNVPAFTTQNNEYSNSYDPMLVNNTTGLSRNFPDSFMPNRHIRQMNLSIPENQEFTQQNNMHHLSPEFGITPISKTRTSFAGFSPLGIPTTLLTPSGIPLTVNSPSGISTVEVSANNDANAREIETARSRNGFTGGVAALKGRISKQLSSQIGLLLSELDAAKDTNIMLRDRLIQSEQDFETLKQFCLNHESPPSNTAHGRISAVVDEIFEAQRQRDSAMRERVTVLENERETLMNKIKSLTHTTIHTADRENSDSGVEFSIPQQPLEGVISNMVATNSASQVKDLGREVVSRLAAQKHHRQLITAEEMAVILKERDAAIDKLSQSDADLRRLRLLETDNNNNMKQLNQLKMELDTLRKSNQESESEILKLQDDVIKYKTMYSELVEAAQTSKSSSTALQAEAEAELDRRAELITELRAYTASIEAELKDLIDKSSVLESKMREEREEREKISKDLNQSKTDLTTLQQESNRLQRLVTVLRRKLNSQVVTTENLQDETTP